MRSVLLVFFFISCASLSSHEKDKWSYEFFISTPETKEAVLQRWGPPTEKGAYSLGGENVEYLRYRNSEGRYFADFFANPRTGKIVEKSYSPDSQSPEFQLKELKEKYFSKDSFEQIPVKCRHHGEVALIQKEKGLLIMTDESATPTVQIIAFLSKEGLNSSIEKMQKSKCRYPWQK